MKADPNACAGCVGACCCDVAVAVTGYDAWRIAAANGLAFTDFLGVATAARAEPGTFRLAGGDAALVLARDPSDDRACVFLDAPDADGVRRCGTYAARPRVCRAYPMELRGRDVGVRSDVTCAPDDWDPAAIDRSAWRRDLVLYVLDREIDALVTATWNATARDGLDAYLTFVRRAYAAIDALRAAYAVECARCARDFEHTGANASDVRLSGGFRLLLESRLAPLAAIDPSP